MSRKQVVAGLLLVAVVGASLAVWLWRPWEGPRNQSGVQVVTIENYEYELNQFRIVEVLRGTGLKTGDILAFVGPDPATACTVVCINQTDKPIDALEFTYSGDGTLHFRSMDGGTVLVSATIPDGVPLDNPHGGKPVHMSGVKTPRVFVGLKPGERRPCCRFFCDGQIDSVTAFAFAAAQSTPQTVATKLAVGGSLVLTFEPGGKVRVEAKGKAK